MVVRSQGSSLVEPSASPVGSVPAHDVINLFLVDSRVLVREGLRALAEQQPDLKVVGGSSSASLGTAYEINPDVVVADVDLPDAHGAEAIALLRKEFPEAALLVLTLVDHPAKVQRVLEAGADGYMLKTAPTSEFFFGIRAVAHGESYLQPSLAWSSRGGTELPPTRRSTSTSSHRRSSRSCGCSRSGTRTPRSPRCAA